MTYSHRCWPGHVRNFNSTPILDNLISVHSAYHWSSSFLSGSYGWGKICSQMNDLLSLPTFLWSWDNACFVLAIVPLKAQLAPVPCTMMQVLKCEPGIHGNCFWGCVKFQQVLLSCSIEV